MEAELACMYLNTTQEQLSCLNGVKARLYLPVTVFLGLLIVVGTLGNITVCLVYGRRKILVSSHYFMLSLAVLDLITCVIGMPTEMADLILPLTFDSPIACKVLRFLHSSTIIASSTILIEVAFDRYFRICQLGRQFTANKARFLCFGALLLGIVFSWPSCVIFGKKTVSIHIQGHSVQGTDCSTDDSMRGTIYPTIYYLFLFSLFGLTLAFFTVLYSKIGLRIVSQNKMRSGGARTCSRGGKESSGSCHGDSGDVCDDTGGSPQDNLARVLRSGMNREMETPCSELSSDPSSGINCSLRHSSASGSSGTSGISGSSGSSASSGVSCRSTRPLMEQSPSFSSTKECTTVVNSNSGISCNTAGDNNTHTVNNGCNVNNGNQIQRKSGSFLDRLQVPTTIHETSRVKILASNLKPIQPYSYKNRSNELIHHSGFSRGASNEPNENIQPHSDVENVNETTNRGRQKSSNKSYDSIPNEISHSKKNKKIKRNLSGLSCCCSCERNEKYPSSISILNRNEVKTSESLPNQNEFDDGTLPRKRKERASATTPAGVHRPCNRQLRVGKTTTVLFAVTLAYILSFLPYLTVMVMRSIVKDLEESLSPMGELAYKLCVKSFFINNAINPIIYSFLNHSFRQDASRVLWRVCWKRSTNSRSNPAASN